MTRKFKKAPGSAGRSLVAQTGAVARELHQIKRMSIAALRDLWRRRFRSEPPPIQSGDILGRLIAWNIQVEAYGGLDAATQTKIEQLVRSSRRKGPSGIPPGPALRAGTILVREWRGVEHRVLVLDQGFEHRDKRYRSLSEAARAITGSRWSGPRFFGLEVGQIAATKEAAP